MPWTDKITMYEESEGGPKNATPMVLLSTIHYRSNASLEGGLGTLVLQPRLQGLLPDLGLYNNDSTCTYLVL